ncbi:hypothetical protein [Curtobacterium flaccumfaciens]|uniref:hypothetical protein n=1 Tax=Curtobacterium flaccumfaciens TaxID=2035 RepID=UPI001BE113C7|nr:hypothetical protein [Curtobacterium flaccumfaciens]MBT1583719.1 hypothetical protein [Curtobacterium flaccumfaciens pv. flaccumfaciens]MCX2798357.1 hypothetical protein [Curtobacterium flaccumfaciens pv. flaccumfaciens]
MDEAVLYDLCSRARLVQVRLVSTEAGLLGLTDFIGRAARCSENYSHARLLQLIQAAPRPVGFRYGFRRLEAVGASRTVPPDSLTDDERGEYEAAQSALLKSVGRDSGEPAPGAVGAVRNVLEQFILRWF